jgi:hypothetical protein
MGRMLLACSLSLGIAFGVAFWVPSEARADAYLDFSSPGQAFMHFAVPEAIEDSGSGEDQEPLPEAQLDTYPVEFYSRILIDESDLKTLQKLILRAMNAF